jgi:hypothetical protein
VVALVVAALIRAGFKKTRLDQKLARWLLGEERASTVDTGTWVSKTVFYVLMFFVLVGFFQALGLTLVSQPLNDFLQGIFQFMPRFLGAAFLLLFAWLAACGLRIVVRRLLNAAKFDERVGNQLGTGAAETSLTHTLAEAVYWLVFLLFLPAILHALALEGLLSPVRDMLDKVLVFLPNILSAAIILVLGWFVARIVQRIVTNLSAAAGIDALSDRLSLSQLLGAQKLSDVLGLVLYVLLLIPVLVASLNALQLEAITAPASGMLQTLLAALPMIFAALLILVVAYVVGRVAAGLITNLLTGVGFNRVLVWLGVGAEPTEEQRTPSEIAGYAVLVTIMLFAVIEAAEQLGFALLAGMITDLTVFAARVVLGLVVFGIGIFLANLVHRTVRASNVTQAGLLAGTARIAIMVLAGAMGLEQMGIADEIIVVAFGLFLGAVAVGAAIALGLGGREIAAQELTRLVNAMKSTGNRRKQQ